MAMALKGMSAVSGVGERHFVINLLKRRREGASDAEDDPVADCGRPQSLFKAQIENDTHVWAASCQRALCRAACTLLYSIVRWIKSLLPLLPRLEFSPMLRVRSR